VPASSRCSASPPRASRSATSPGGSICRAAQYATICRPSSPRRVPATAWTRSASPARMDGCTAPRGSRPGDVPLTRMPFHQLDVPALPILLPLGIVLMAVSGVLLHRRGLLSARRLATAWLAGWYAVAVIGATLLPLHLAWGPGAGPAELYRIILVPLITTRGDDFLLNIVMTLPLAAVLFLVFGVREKRRVVLVGFLVSLAVEI